MKGTKRAPVHRSAMRPAASFLALLVAEVLYLTVSFDTAALARVPASWAPLVGWTPQFLRLAITVVGVTALTSGTKLRTALNKPHSRAAWSRPAYLAANLCTFAVFVGITAVVMGAGFFAIPHQGFWALTWLAAARAGRWGLVLGFGVGSVAWASGFLTEELWHPLARYTFAVVQGILGVIYVDTVSDPAKLVVGTPSFHVAIAPSCSGYEGVGLILAFLGVYLFLSRKTLRFP